MAGAPIIAGTRVRVSDVVRHRNLLGSVAGVKRALPHLTRGQIGVALKYYTENREDIDSEIQEEDALLAEARKRRAST